MEGLPRGRRKGRGGGDAFSSQAIKEQPGVPGSYTRWKDAQSQGPLQSQVALKGREDRALRRGSSSVGKAKAEEGLQPPILAWPGAPSPGGVPRRFLSPQEPSCQRLLSGASNSALEEKLPARRQNCSASSQVTPGALSAVGFARTFRE